MGTPAAVAVCEAGVLSLRSGAKFHVHLAGGSIVAAIEPEEPHAGIQAPDLEGAWP